MLVNPYVSLFPSAINFLHAELYKIRHYYILKETNRQWIQRKERHDSKYLSYLLNIKMLLCIICRSIPSSVMIPAHATSTSSFTTIISVRTGLMLNDPLPPHQNTLVVSSQIKMGLVGERLKTANSPVNLLFAKVNKNKILLEDDSF